jgi:hypothetical protein
VGAASKLLQTAVGLVLAVTLSLGIVIFLLLGALSGLASADAQCDGPTPQDQSLMGWPTDRHQIDGDWTIFHRGYDFQVKEDDKVYASQDGKVVMAKDNEVRIRLESVETRYKYLKTISVSNGADVKRGEQIGTAGIGDEGTDGNGAPIGLVGAHVHWEMWADQENKDKWSIVPKPDENPFVLDGSKGGSCSCVNGDLSGSNNQQKVFNFFVQNGFSKEQAAGVVGNMQAESSVEPTLKQGDLPGTVTMPKDVIGFSGGWGLVQWTPASKMINPSRDAGVPDEKIASLGYQLEYLLKQLNGGGQDGIGPELKATKTIAEAARLFADKFERFGGHEDPNHPTYAERIANAQHVFDQFAGSAPAGGGAQNAGAGGCGAGSGNIAEVAKNLAWPEGGHDGTDASIAKPEYVEAMEKFNDGSSGYVPYSDCGRFVATVMRMSGADKDFPKVSTGVQFDYMQDSGKYDYWHAVPPGGMKPGDILNGPGHTYLYVGPWGKDGGGYDSAAASLGGHVPEAGHLYDVGGQFWVFRLKNAPQPAS